MTMKAILIAEKPSLARSIEDAYKKMNFPDEIHFLALRGHILTLLSPEEYDSSWGRPWRKDVLPMIPEKFKYKVVVQKDNDCRELYKKVKDELTSNKYDYVINACDAGREGELIFYEIYKTTGCKLPIKRFWSNSTTEDACKKALNNLIDDKDPSLKCLKASSQYRAYFDWLVGMNFSRAFTLQANSGTTHALGRVMTPTLAMIVNRELEIQNFVPQNYWEIKASFNTNPEYEGTYIDDEKESKIFDKSKADSIISSLSGFDGIVESVDKVEEKKNAPTLHSLLELQREANRVHGYSPDETLKIAQELYENKKILSYPRTESRYLPTDIIKEIPKHLKAIEGVKEVGKFVSQLLANPQKINNVLSTKKYVDDQKLTDHHAIIPTEVEPLISSLSEKELNIYLLVVKRFVAIFLDPERVAKTTVITKINDKIFETVGKTTIDKGFTILYNDNIKEDSLPNLKKGDKHNVKNIIADAKKTSPPSRYNGDSLLSAMQNPGKFVDDESLKNVLKESAGLGTSSTRANIISKLIDRKLVEMDKKFYIPTKEGIELILALESQDITSPELTAKWEMKLRKIEDQKYDVKKFYTEMLEYIKVTTSNFLNSIINMSSSGNPRFEQKVIGKCPVCNEDVVEGKNYYFCSKYKQSCTLIIGKSVGGVKLSSKDIKNLLDGKESKEYEFTWKSGKKSFDTLKIIDGKICPVKASSRKKVFNTIGICPICGKDVVNAIDFYLCKGYSDNTCTFNIKKVIKDGKIEESDAKEILLGNKTSWISFRWKSNKTGEARLYWDKTKNELCWDFPPRK